MFIVGRGGAALDWQEMPALPSRDAPDASHKSHWLLVPISPRLHHEGDGGGGYGEEEEASHSPRHPMLYFPLVRSAVPPPTGNKGCGAGVAW